MKLPLLGGGLVVAAIVAWKTIFPALDEMGLAQHGAQFRVTTEIRVKQVTPFGVNLGNWTSWGAEQLSSNVLKNPGFEGIIDRAIVIPEHALPGSFDDSPAWLARPANFWDGAHFDVRSGAQAGTGGVVSRSLPRNLFGLPAFLVEDESKIPLPGEVVAVTKESDDQPPTQWWLEGDAGSFSPANGETRPGSPGTRSLQVTAYNGKPAAVVSYLDTIGARAGKLLPLDGTWALSFWVKAPAGGARLHVAFGRDGASPALSQNVALASGWTNPRFTFSARDEGAPGTVSLRFQVTGDPVGKIYLDDVDLRRAADADFPFRREVVDTLLALHPRYLRDWEGQLGDTLANRVAPAFARKAYRYRPGDLMATDFGYGLRDVLDLCLRVGADPWIIVPTTFSDEECGGLGDYLASQPDTKRFHELIVEFGNENWNLIFRPAGIPNAFAHGQAADRCLALVRQHAPRLPVKPAINAQHANVPAAIEYAQQSQESAMEAVAPYFLPELAHHTPEPEALASLFAGDGGRLKKIAAAMADLHKETAVYEVNLTTISGTAMGEERLPIVAGIASGTALAKTMLDGLALGVRRQCVYSLAGFDAQLPDNEGFVRLWGIARDLSAPARLRPTGLALELLNEAVAGDMYRVEASGSKHVSAYAFRSPRGWAVALVSSASTPEKVRIQLPTEGGGAVPLRLLQLSCQRFGVTNEDAEEVRIDRQDIRWEGNALSLDLAPLTFAVLVPAGGAE